MKRSIFLLVSSIALLFSCSEKHAVALDNAICSDQFMRALEEYHARFCPDDSLQQRCYAVLFFSEKDGNHIQIIAMPDSVPCFAPVPGKKDTSLKRYIGYSEYDGTNGVFFYNYFVNASVVNSFVNTSALSREKVPISYEIAKENDDYFSTTLCVSAADYLIRDDMTIVKLN